MKEIKALQKELEDLKIKRFELVREINTIRINKVKEILGFKFYNELADYFGIPKQYLSEMKKGKRPIRKDILKKIDRVIKNNINNAWQYR